MSYYEAVLAVERLEAEAGCYLPDLDGFSTLGRRADRLLSCENPPIGEEAALCEAIRDGDEPRYGQ